MTSDSTVASTGRLMQISGSCMRRLRRQDRGAAAPPPDLGEDAVASVLAGAVAASALPGAVPAPDFAGPLPFPAPGAAGAPATPALPPPAIDTGEPSRSFSCPALTTRSPAASPLTISTMPSRRWPVTDLHAVRLAVDDAEHELLLALWHQRLLGQHQRLVDSLGDQPDAGEHPGTQRRVGVLHLRADDDRAPRGVDQRIDREDLALVRLAGQRVQRDFQRLADRDLAEVDLGHAEIDLERVDRLEVHHVGALLDVVADGDRAQPDDAGERSLDLGLGEPRVGERQRRFGHLQVVLGLVPGLPGDEPLGLELARALVLGAGQREVGLGLLHLRLVDRRVEAHQCRALGHPLTLLETDNGNPARGLGAHGDRLVGAQAPDGGDRLGHRRSGDLDGLDGGASAAARRAGRLGRARRSTARRRQGEGTGRRRSTLLPEPVASARSGQDTDDRHSGNDALVHSMSWQGSCMTWARACRRVAAVGTNRELCAATPGPGKRQARDPRPTGRCASIAFLLPT